MLNICGTVLWGSDPAHLEVLRVSLSANHVLRLVAEWIERAILLQVFL